MWSAGTTHHFPGLGRLLLPAFLLAIVAGPARAATVEISYRLASGVVFTNDGSFPITGGMYTIRYTAAGEFSLLSGPATLKTFSFSASGFTYEGYFNDRFTLRLSTPQGGVGTSQGRFTPLNSFLLIGAIGVHCYAYCATYGLSPSVPASFSLGADVASATFLLSPASGSFTGSFTAPGFDLGSFTVLFVNSQELSRTFMPEPSADWLALAVVGTVAALAAPRRWRRASRRSLSATGGAPTRQ